VLLSAAGKEFDFVYLEDRQGERKKVISVKGFLCVSSTFSVETFLLWTGRLPKQKFGQTKEKRQTGRTGHNSIIR